MKPSLRRLRPVAAVAVLGALTSCSSGGQRAGDGGSGRLDVVASSYPLAYVAEQVGGDRVTVTDLTAAGADSHDLELTPAQVAHVGEADVVVHLSGFQAATDEALGLREGGHVVDAAEAAALEVEPGSATAGPAEDALDPHFWLDPTRLAQVARQVADELTAADPDHAEDHAAAAAELTASLAALDAEYAAALAPCRGATLVTSHEAFGYLAQRYGLEQVGIAGIDPDVEPSPARLREVVEVVEAHDVRTLYFETLTSPDLTRTLADDLGLATAVLDPVEGLADAGSDYPSLMRANLRALREGLVCGA